jgi:hypothetical protein
MILDTTLKTIEIVLAGAKTTNDCEYTVDYADTNSGTSFVPAGSMGLTNGTTFVTAVPAPTGVQRHIKALTVYNADTVNSTVSVRMFDGTNRRIVIKQLLTPGQSLVYTTEGGWSVPGFSGVAQVLGTWTPVDVSGAALSLTITNATYIKMGQQVTLNYFIVYPSTASGATALIGGAPFVASGYWLGPAPATTFSFVRIDGSSTTLLPLDTAGNAKTNAQLSTLTLLGSIVYKSV